MTATKKTRPGPTLVISNFNTVPLELIKYSDSWVILDQSDDREVIARLNRTFPEATFGKNTFTNGVVKMPHVGHNLLDYLWWIKTHANKSEATIAFVKGNIVPRHVESWSFLDAALQSSRAPLWFEHAVNQRQISNEGLFLERNNSWYVSSRPYKYFGYLDDFANFFFQDWKSSRRIEFSPGACVVTTKDLALQVDPVIIVGLERVLDHAFFPSEAYFLERVFHKLVWNDASTKDYGNEGEILERLEALLLKPVTHDAPGPLRMGRRAIRLLKERS